MISTSKEAGRIPFHSSQEESVQVVELVIGDKLFAVNLFDTREVITTPEVTPIPNAPAFLTGMIDLRGVITTIIDLRILMQIDTDAVMNKKSRIIILDKALCVKPIGILVDDVLSVSTYRSSDIDWERENSQNSSRNIIGIIRKSLKAGDTESNKLIIWLDIQTLITGIEQDL